mgnify:CR=1 FL=1
MKKLIAMAAAVMMVMALTACGAPAEEQPEEQVDYEIALVTDSGLIMDGGYSEVAWTAISEFGAENGISHKYYKAADANEESYMLSIDDAVSRGAKVIVVDGYSFDDVIYDAQEEYKDVKFILIDSEPVEPETGEVKIAKNTTAALFASEEAGYMAGFAAVKEGYSQLGFICEADNAEMDDYGYGFLQGANAAAAQNGVSVDVKYYACEDTGDRNNVMEKAREWYQQGTEAIFACGPQVEMSIIEAAEMEDKDVIACETDKSEMSDTVVTSAVKDIAGVLDDMLQAYAKDEFPGGKSSWYDVSTESISMDMETSRFAAFSESDYRELIRALGDKSVEVMDHSAGEISVLGLTNVTVAEE